MNVDKNLIRHWAFLCESEETRMNWKPLFESGIDEKLEVLGKDPCVSLFDLEKFEFTFGLAPSRIGFVQMFYILTRGRGTTDGNRFKKEIDEFFSAIDFDFERFTHGGDDASPRREEDAYRSIKDNPQDRRAFIKFISDIAATLKDGETARDESVTRIGNGTPRFLFMYDGWGIVILDSIESVYEYYLKTIYGYDGSTSPEDYDYPPSSGFYIRLVSERYGDIVNIYVGDDEDRANSLYDEIREKYPSGHADYYKGIEMEFANGYKTIKRDSDVGISKQEGEELFRKYNVKPPVDKTHPVYVLAGRRSS